MDLNVLIMKFSSLEMARRDIPKIRGYIAEQFSEIDELHNHKGEKFIYRYPIIQYKTVEGKPAIIGINKGADIIMQIEDKLDNIRIQGEYVEIYEKSIEYKRQTYGITNDLVRYKFESPWMCLNEDNHKQYEKSNEEQKNEILKRILAGNILSMSKSFNYTVEQQLTPYINLKPDSVKFKNMDMMTFKGEFLVNFNIPEYLGIGKSVSRGFGVVKMVKESTFK